MFSKSNSSSSSTMDFPWSGAFRPLRRGAGSALSRSTLIPWPANGRPLDIVDGVVRKDENSRGPVGLAAVPVRLRRQARQTNMAGVGCGVCVWEGRKPLSGRARRMPLHTVQLNLDSCGGSEWWCWESKLEGGPACLLFARFDLSLVFLVMHLKVETFAAQTSAMLGVPSFFEACLPGVIPPWLQGSSIPLTGQGYALTLRETREPRPPTVTEPTQLTNWTRVLFCPHTHSPTHSHNTSPVLLLLQRPGTVDDL